MANSDLKLENNGVAHIEGNVLKVDAFDLNLDNAARRGGKAGAHRRALVHSPGDGLTINWAHDYTGGVTINGPTTINGPHGGKGYTGGLTINGPASINGPTVVKGILVVCKHKPDPNGPMPALTDPAKLAAKTFGGSKDDYVAVDVFDILGLAAQIVALKAQLAALAADVAALKAQP